MGYWNYRVMRKSFPTLNNEMEEWYRIHQVHYNRNDKIEGHTVKGVAPGGSSLEEIKKDIDLMLKAFDKPVLEYDEKKNKYMEV